MQQRYNPTIYEVGPGKTYGPANSLPAAADHAIQSALDAASLPAGDDLVVVYPNNPSCQPAPEPARRVLREPDHHQPVKLQGVGPGSPDGSVRGSIIDGGAFGGDSPVATDWYAKIGTLDVGREPDHLRRCGDLALPADERPAFPTTFSAIHGAVDRRLRPPRRRSAGLPRQHQRDRRRPHRPAAAA